MSSGINHAHESEEVTTLDSVQPTVVHPNPSAATHGLRYDNGKAPMELLCPVALEGAAMVLLAGAKKYAPRNWEKGMPWGTIIGCLLRHTFKFLAGEDLDKETGLPHVDHITCNALFLANYYRKHKALDDRYKGDEKAQKEA